MNNEDARVLDLAKARLLAIREERIEAREIARGATAILNRLSYEASEIKALCNSIVYPEPDRSNETPSVPTRFEIPPEKLRAMTRGSLLETGRAYGCQEYVLSLDYLRDLGKKVGNSGDKRIEP